ncbi:MAG: outer membrane protein assembly factor [Rubellimicrobium sp.]|nr:outer membrane protein assembly factor [Rubellimicrobium sp.]
MPRNLPSLGALALTALLPAFLSAQEVGLTVTTGDDDLAVTLRGNSLTYALQDEDDHDAVEAVAAARADYRRLLTALYSQGYYGGSISIRIDGREAAGIAPLDAPDRVRRIDITVDPGPQFTFGTLSVEPRATGTPRPEGLTTGAVAASTVLEDAAQGAVDGWRQAGYPLAAVAGQDIRAIHATSRLDAAITLAPGPRLTFGPLTVRGNERMRAERIIAIAGLPEGAVYSPADIDRAALRLRRTGVFASAALIEATAPGPGGTLPVTAQVQEMPLHRLGFGAEISSTEGLSLSAFWLHRNLWGGAERLRLEAEVTGIEGAAGLGHSGPDLRLAGAFSRPATLAPDIDLTADLAFERRDEPDYLSTRLEGALGFTRHGREGVTQHAGLGFIAAREEMPWRTRDYVLATLPLAATWERRDNALDATRGWYLDVEATPFLAISGGDDGARLYADARYYHSFGDAHRVTLALRGQVGSVMGAGLLDAPADFLFYSGGGGTVRGQPYQALGIDLSPGRAGGRSFVGLQAEARVHVTQSISAVGFYDFGMIDSDSFPGDTALHHAGAGIGLRYDTAIGPIRLDVATPAGGQVAGGSVQVYIGIGQAF